MQKGFTSSFIIILTAFVVIAIIVVLYIRYSFLIIPEPHGYGALFDSDVIQEPKTPTLSTQPAQEELRGFPIYPNAIFIGKQPIIPCMNGADKNGFSTCNAVVYLWKTSDDFDAVNSWYSQKQWLCGGAGQYISPRDASGGGNNCTKNNKRFGTFFAATAQETRITFALYP